MVVPTPKLTADEFLARHGDESHVDLVRGEVVRFAPAGAARGLVCASAGFELRAFVKANRLGRVMGFDTFIRLSGGTVRGADVCFLSYAKLPADQKLPQGALDVMPELVIEVRSPSDLWTEVFAKVTDYLDAGVAAVVVLDPATSTATVCRPGPTQETVAADGTLTLPDVLPGFAVPVARFFEE